MSKFKKVRLVTKKIKSSFAFEQNKLELCLSSQKLNFETICSKPTLDFQLAYLDRW